jgi:hypothetical protein
LEDCRTYLPLDCDFERGAGVRGAGAEQFGASDCEDPRFGAPRG